MKARLGFHLWAWSYRLGEAREAHTQSGDQLRAAACSFWLWVLATIGRVAR